MFHQFNPFYQPNQSIKEDRLQLTDFSRIPYVVTSKEIRKKQHTTISGLLLQLSPQPHHLPVLLKGVEVGCGYNQETNEVVVCKFLIQS